MAKVKQKANGSVWVDGMKLYHEDEKLGHDGRSIDVRIVSLGEYERLKTRRRWSAVRLDDGRVLMVRGRGLYRDDDKHQDMPRDPESVEAMRGLRSLMVDFLDDASSVSYAEMVLGGDGTATFRVTHASEKRGAHERAIITIGPDPDA